MMSEVTREAEYPTTDYERAVEMLRRMAVQGDMGNGARVVKMHLDAIVEERDSLRSRVEELDATIGQQAVDLAHRDVRIAALESETESGEALVRARHYQGLCEELRGKVAELEATRAQSIAESIAERAGSGYIAQVPVRRGWMHPDEFCEHGIKHSKPCRWCYPPVPVSPQPEDDPK